MFWGDLAGKVCVCLPIASGNVIKFKILNNQYVLWLVAIILHMVLRHPGIYRYENQTELLELVSLAINHTHKWSWGPVYASHVLTPWIKTQLLPPCLPFSHNYHLATCVWYLLSVNYYRNFPYHRTKRQTSLPAWSLAYINILSSLPASHHFVWCLPSNIIFGNFVWDILIKLVQKNLLDTLKWWEIL